MRLLVLLYILGFSQFAYGQSAPDPQEVLEQAAEPGPEHEMLTRYAGEWRVKIKAWPAKSDNPETISAKAKIRSILDGRFIEIRMWSRGINHSFAGRTLLGFNNVSRKYEGSWIHNYSSGIFSAEGSVEKDGKEIVFLGALVDPLSKTLRQQKVLLQAAEESLLIIHSLKDEEKDKVWNKRLEFRFRPAE